MLWPEIIRSLSCSLVPCRSFLNQAPASVAESGRFVALPSLAGAGIKAWSGGGLMPSEVRTVNHRSTQGSSTTSTAGSTSGNMWWRYRLACMVLWTLAAASKYLVIPVLSRSKWSWLLCVASAHLALAYTTKSTAPAKTEFQSHWVQSTACNLANSSTVKEDAWTTVVGTAVIEHPCNLLLVTTGCSSSMEKMYKQKAKASR